MRHLIWLALLGACFQNPEGLDGDDVVRLEVRGASQATANGTDLVTVLVHVDPSTSSSFPVALTTSSGALNLSVNPDSDAARQVSLAHQEGAGVLEVPMRVGTQAGTVFLTATLAGIRATYEFDLQEALPSALVVTSDRTQLLANGSNQLSVMVSAVNEPGERNSRDLPLQVEACCGPAPDELAPCTPAAPLVPVAPLALSDSGVVGPVILRSEPSGEPARTVWVTAGIPDGPPTSCSPAANAVWGAAPILVTPGAP